MFQCHMKNIKKSVESVYADTRDQDQVYESFTHLVL